MPERIDETLRWMGFRPLTAAEASAGGYARHPGERRLARIDATALSMAIVTSATDSADVRQILDGLAMDSWTYDLNLGRNADALTAVNELRVVMSTPPAALEGALPAMGFRLRGCVWVKLDQTCPIPDLGAEYAEEIFPGIGHVLAPNAVSEFGPSEQRIGYYSKSVPHGAYSEAATRGYRFIHGGYRVRTITRRRIVAAVDPALPAQAMQAIVEAAVAATYADA